MPAAHNFSVAEQKSNQKNQLKGGGFDSPALKNPTPKTTKEGACEPPLLDTPPWDENFALCAVRNVENSFGHKPSFDHFFDNTVEMLQLNSVKLFEIFDHFTHQSGCG